MNNKTDFEKWLQKNVIIIYSVISSIQFRLTANISRDWGRKEQTVYQAEWMKVNSGFFLSPKKERNIIEVVLVLQSCRCGMEITLCSWTDEQCCTGATELYLHSVSQLYLLLMFDIYLHKKWKSQLYLLSENAMLQLYLL